MEDKAGEKRWNCWICWIQTSFSNDSKIRKRSKLYCIHTEIVWHLHFTEQHRIYFENAVIENHLLSPIFQHQKAGPYLALSLSSVVTVQNSRESQPKFNAKLQMCTTWTSENMAIFHGSVKVAKFVVSSKEPECSLHMEVDDAGDSNTDSQAEEDDSMCYWYVCSWNADIRLISEIVWSVVEPTPCIFSGKPRDLASADLLCAFCLKYYHTNCVTVYTGWVSWEVVNAFWNVLENGNSLQSCSLWRQIVVPDWNPQLSLTPVTGNFLYFQKMFAFHDKLPIHLQAVQPSRLGELQQEASQ